MACTNCLTETDAKLYWQTRKNIKDACLQYIIPAINSHRAAIELTEVGLTDKALSNFADNFSAYVFTQSDINRFFNGDEDNPTITFDKLMIIVGSVPDNSDRQRSPGEQTVLIAGCREYPVSSG
jgi:hypothetical protein